jgi:hypothetical protein
VQTAQAGPQIPVAAMQTRYVTALASWQGRHGLRAAISPQPDGDEYIVTTENLTMLHASASALASGSEDMYRATAGIMVLSRRN